MLCGGCEDAVCGALTITLLIKKGHYRKEKSRAVADPASENFRIKALN
jgi:hypothetical protein